MSNLYKGTGSIKDFEHSLDFLDRAFFEDDPDEADTHFLTMLPKLYKKEYNHCEKNHIVSLDGEWLAAVGLYVDEMDICGEKILCGGIGNVAVRKDCRGKGYMKDCMGLAKEKCLEDNVDFMILGGQRQRYGYFGFEPAGIKPEYHLNEINIRHTFGKDFVSPVTAHIVEVKDTEALDFIFELYNNAFRSRIIRKREMPYDIISSWHQHPFIFKENGKPIGYAIISECNDYVTEIAAVDAKSFYDILPPLLKASGKDGIKIRIQPYLTAENQILTDICELSTVSNCKMINILNWKRMVYALLKLKSTYKKLCDGEQSFLIHGNKKDELFTVKIKDNAVNIVDGGKDYIELTHKEAMNLFFGLFSDRRKELSPEISGWLPLEFMLFYADIV